MGKELLIYFCCILVALVVLQEASSENIPVCLTNCIQCKQMFGRYFHGRACGNDCIASNGRASPDCNNPDTLNNYLKRFY